VPAGELTFETWMEKEGEIYRWAFRGLQRGLINMLGRQLFESLAGRIVEKTWGVPIRDTFIIMPWSSRSTLYMREQQSRPRRSP
jgi:hypothetical protein